MAQTAVIIETPALAEVGVPIITSAYDVLRDLNAAGAFSVAFPASTVLASQVKSRWRVSVIEEGRAGYLLRRGIVNQRSYRVEADGTGILTLNGYSHLYKLAGQSTHLGLEYDGFANLQAVAENITGEAVAAPGTATGIFPKITFNDSSKLAALLSVCELARFNVRESFDEDGFELVSQDNVPDSGYRFVTAQTAGPEIENAAENGLGLIAGTPIIGYAGGDVCNRIIPIGADFDGSPLTLQNSNKSSPYDIRSSSNPDSTAYYYLEDDDAYEYYGNEMLEFQYFRTDVKNPSDDAGTRLLAANALYQVAADMLHRRRYEIISFACEIANGRHIDALPGDRVRIQFRGRARTPTGFLTWQDVDQDFLIVKRRDSAGEAGVRGVSFTLTAPEVPMVIPLLPDAVPIPPPPRDPPNPPDPRPDDNSDGYGGSEGPGDGGAEDAGPDVPPFEDPGLPIDPGMPELTNPVPDGKTFVQDCCTNHVRDIPESPNESPPGGGDVFGGGALIGGIPPDGTPIPVDAAVKDAVAGDKFLMVTWSHAHDGGPNSVTPSAPWLSSVTSVDSIEAADGEARDTGGTAYDVTAGLTRVEVWIADIVPGSIGSNPQVTFSDPASSNWPNGGSTEVSYGGYGLLLHNPDPSTPLPQVNFASAVSGPVEHTMAAPDPSSQYLVVAYQRGIVGGGGGGSLFLQSPSGWSRAALVYQDIELGQFGELVHDQAFFLVARHNAEGETAIEWDGTGTHMISVAIEVKPA